jgi:citrate synthase
MQDIPAIPVNPAGLIPPIATSQGAVIPAGATSALLHVMDVSPMPSVSCGRPAVSDQLYEGVVAQDQLPQELYEQYHVKRGLRNKDGSGVPAGLTRISNVHGYNKVDGVVVPDEGDLIYRGYPIGELVGHAQAEGRFGYEEVSYLLITGSLPNRFELGDFMARMDARRQLPIGYLSLFPRTTASSSIMNVLQRATLLLYAFDETPDDTSPQHEIDVAISLLARLPRIAAVAHAAYRSEADQTTLRIPPVTEGLSVAQTILDVLRPDGGYTREEALALDVMLMLHAEHGGGNNSTFTTRVLSSSGTDAYSAYAGAMGSLKGPKHGGANRKVGDMVDDIAAHVGEDPSDAAVEAYLTRIARKEAFDRTGLIYGLGHAVYTISDPRAQIIKEIARGLATSTGNLERMALLESIERTGPAVVAAARGTQKPICANVDLYAGFVYRMLGIAEELHTPIFAIARLSGWVAHRLEELYGAARIIRPAYASVLPPREYVPLKDR